MYAIFWDKTLYKFCVRLKFVTNSMSESMLQKSVSYFVLDFCCKTRASKVRWNWHDFKEIMMGTKSMNDSNL